MKNKIPIFILLFLLSFVSEASPDTIHLKNGRKMEGLIKKETEDSVWLDLGIGSVKFRWEQIEKIDRSSPDDAARIRQKWRGETKVAEKKREPKEVDFSKKRGRMIMVEALLNNKVKASLMVDTGASCVKISRRIAEELGIKITGAKERMIRFQVADGRLVDAEYIVLDSVNVQGVKLRNVGAAVTLSPEGDTEDGLLGMSFLKNFKFQIDNVSKKLTLEERKAQSILQEAGDFSVKVPSNWECWGEDESLSIYGPRLITETGLIKPRIRVSKFTRTRALSYVEYMREEYNSYKDGPGVTRKMSELHEWSFKNSSPQDKFISSGFEEKKDAIMLHTVYIDNEKNLKTQEAYFIAKNKALGSYALGFACPEKYFDKYLPVFEKCIESFNIIEK